MGRRVSRNGPTQNQKPTTTAARSQKAVPAATEAKAKSRRDAGATKGKGYRNVNGCPVPESGTGRHRGEGRRRCEVRVRGNCGSKGRVKDARLKSKSRRPLQKNAPSVPMRRRRP